MADSGSPFASTNALVEVYGRYVDWVEKLGQDERPQSDGEWVDALLGLLSIDEELLDRAIGLKAAVDARALSDLPLEVQPEVQFAVDYVAEIPDVAKLHSALARRSDRVRAIKASGEPMTEPFPTDLPEPFQAQWVGVREAAKLLFSQVQLHNAQARAAAFERAAELNGMPVKTSTHRGDDGSFTHTVSVSFDRGEQPKATWWQRLFGRSA